MSAANTPATVFPSPVRTPARLAFVSDFLTGMHVARTQTAHQAVALMRAAYGTEAAQHLPAALTRSPRADHAMTTRDASLA